MSLAAEDIVSFLRRLRAVKEYSDEPVDEQAIESILEVGRWTGTGGNRQPTEIVVVRDPDLRAKMGEWGARPAAERTGRLAAGRSRRCLAAGRGAHGRAAVPRCGCARARLDRGDAQKRGAGRREAGTRHPAQHRARTLVAVGHPNAEAPRFRPTNSTTAPGRKPMSEFAHWDRY